MKENSAAIHVQAPVDVAAFLLNEKRGEILKIETRHRVSVVLIPNKHLETPHYKLERIKHDDPRLEEAQSSYMMTEQAETEVGYGQRQKEELKPRQEAVVKGITPDQPAPIVERRPIPAVPEPSAPTEEGFFSKLFGLFRKKPVPPAPAPVEKPQQPRERTERNGRNSQRSRSRSRGKDRQDDREGNRPDAREDVQKVGQSEQPTRPQRQPKEARDQTPKEAREPREANESRRERSQERPPRPPREERKDNAVAKNETGPAMVQPSSSALPLAAALAAAPAVSPPSSSAAVNEENLPESALDAASVAEAGEGSEEQRRRRRRRGGRNRNRRDRETGMTTEGESETDVLESGDEALDAKANGTVALATRIEVTSAETAVMAMEIPVVVAQVTGFTESGPAAPKQYAAEQAEHEARELASLAEPSFAQHPAKENPGSENQLRSADLPSAAPAPETEFVPEAATPAPAPAPVPESRAETVRASAVATSAPASSNGAPDKSMRLEDFQDMLSAAGLTLAVTNPDKLKAAQEAAANSLAAPRVPRERKPALPLSNEPLIQVETVQR